jgi:hypothetical protein
VGIDDLENGLVFTDTDFIADPVFIDSGVKQK